MKFIFRNVLKNVLIFTLILCLFTNTNCHKRRWNEGEFPRGHQNFSDIAQQRSKYFYNSKFVENQNEMRWEEKEFYRGSQQNPKRGHERPKSLFENPNHSKEWKYWNGKKHHNKDFKINRYEKDAQFLKNSNICPEHSILIDGDCVDHVDVGLINFLAMFIAGGLFFLMLIAILIAIVCVCRKCRRKSRCFRKFRKMVGFKRNHKIKKNSDQQINHRIEKRNMNNNVLNNQNNSFISKQENSYSNLYEENNHQNHNICHNYNNLPENQKIMQSPDFNQLPIQTANNPASDFSNGPFTFGQNATYNQNGDSKIFKKNENFTMNSVIKADEKINLEKKYPSFLGKKINGILNYFPKLGKQLLKNPFEKLDQNNMPQHLSQNEVIPKNIQTNYCELSTVNTVKNPINSNYNSSEKIFINPYNQINLQSNVDNNVFKSENETFNNQINFEQSMFILIFYSK